jgi:hypothetical protein
VPVWIRLLLLKPSTPIQADEYVADDDAATDGTVQVPVTPVKVPVSA